MHNHYDVAILLAVMKLYLKDFGKSSEKTRFHFHEMTPFLVQHKLIKEPGFIGTLTLKELTEQYKIPIGIKR